MSDRLDVRVGDCREVLATLPPASVHCVVTSPPYWGLRDYGTASWDGGDPECDHAFRPDAGSTSQRAGRTYQQGHPHRECRCGARRVDAQLGLEPTPEAYVAAMVDVFRAVWRVLRDDGTVWLNLGDSYATSNATGRRDADRRGEAGVFTDGEWHDRQASGGGSHVKPLAPGLKQKDLVGIPWRVAFALQADGWYLRSDVIWSKPNPMPESVTDRPTKSHEYLFLLSKTPRYYFDAEAVREPAIYAGEQLGIVRGTKRRALAMGRSPSGNEVPGADADIAAGRNIRTVWTIATQPYPGAHFATFPEALVAPCIKAGTSERGVCPECGAPWRRVVERPQPPKEMRQSAPPDKMGYHTRAVSGGGGAIDRWYKDNPSTTTGWRSTCAHDAEPVPAVVLDCFGGSGTVGKVANKLSRHAILIELNPEYIEQVDARTAQEVLGLAG